MFSRSVALQRYAHIGRFIIASAVALSIARMALLAVNITRIEPGLLPMLALQGIRFDLIVLAYLSIVPLLLSVVTPNRFWPQLRHALSLFYRMAFAVLLGMEAVGFGFLLEYDHRPDALFWEYLRYPQEVVPMLVGGFKLEMALAFIALAGAYFLGRWLFQSRGRATLDSPFRTRGAIGFLVLIGLFVMARSSFGHRPANMTSAMFSANRLANDLALNSTYTAAYALYARKNDSNVKVVPAMPLQVAAATLAQDLGASGWRVDDPQAPTMHMIEPTQRRERPLNVVIVLEESLGARFVGSLGGAALTPNLEALSTQGLWLTRLYATGTRTVRGIEAVLAGFPPSTARSVLKRNLSRRNFFTLAQALKPHGYTSMFIYGGEPNFDEMGSFMLGNGFDKVVAGSDSFPDAEFRGSWGVSDEDWAQQAHKEFVKANEQGPFFGFMLSTSNHTPWEFPQGRIDPQPGPVASRVNAVRYADYALGLFFDLALNSEYADNTVFVVVADHDARASGNDYLPVDGFHIPGLIIAPGLAPGHYDEVASQIDLLPTIMPMLGVALHAPVIGRNLLDPESPLPGRALMQFGNNIGLLRGNTLVVNTPSGEPIFQTYAGGVQSPANYDADLYELSKAYLNLAEQLYAQHAYAPLLASVQGLKSGTVSR